MQIGNVIVRLSDGTDASKESAVLVNAHLDSYVLHYLFLVSLTYTLLHSVLSHHQEPPMISSVSQSCSKLFE